MQRVEKRMQHKLRFTRLLILSLLLFLVGCAKYNGLQDYSDFSKTLGTHARGVKAVVFSADGDTVYSSDGSHLVLAWDVNAALPVFGGGEAKGQVLSLNANTAVVSNFNLLRIIDVVNRHVTNNLVVGLDTATAYPKYAYLSSDGTKVLLVDLGSNVSLWDLNKGLAIHSFLTSSSGKVNYGHDASAFSPTDSVFLIASSKRSNIEIRDVKSGGIIRTLEVHDRGVRATAFSSDGNNIATVGMDNSFKLWNIKSGLLLEKFDTSAVSIINQIVYPPDSKLVITGHNDGSIVIWNIETGNVLKHFMAHTGWVETIAISPNGSGLVSGGSDKKVKFWSLAKILAAL